MSIKPKTRFEVFKRDRFTCRYCGKASPEVVLEVDHIVPKSKGGTDDPMNLATSCWECNRGKASVPLNEVMTGEDPHDAAILILEKERQLKEYNRVLKRVKTARLRQRARLVVYWGQRAPGHASLEDEKWLLSALKKYPSELIKTAMNEAIRRGHTGSFRYVAGCLKNWHAEALDQ